MNNKYTDFFNEFLELQKKHNIEFTAMAIIDNEQTGMITSGSAPSNWVIKTIADLAGHVSNTVDPAVLSGVLECMTEQSIKADVAKMESSDGVQ